MSILHSASLERAQKWARNNHDAGALQQRLRARGSACYLNFIDLKQIECMRWDQSHAGDQVAELVI
jgi:hypothetical protein